MRVLTPLLSLPTRDTNEAYIGGRNVAALVPAIGVQDVLKLKGLPGAACLSPAKEVVVGA